MKELRESCRRVREEWDRITNATKMGFPEKLSLSQIPSGSPEGQLHLALSHHQEGVWADTPAHHSGTGWASRQRGGVQSPLGIFKEVALATQGHFSGKGTVMSNESPKPTEAGRRGTYLVRGDVSMVPMIRAMIAKV